MSNRDILSTPVTVTMSVSDWLSLAGWCSAHLNEWTPNIVVASVREICRTVDAGE